MGNARGKHRAGSLSITLRSPCCSRKILPRCIGFLTCSPSSDIRCKPKGLVYTWCIYVEGGSSMATAKVFRSGNSQALRLPKEFRLKSKEVEIFGRGDEIVLREKSGLMARASVF